MDIKTLNKLARACKKLGISHLKTNEIDITFSADIAIPGRKRQCKSPVNESLFEAGTLPYQKEVTEPSETDLLFWSAGDTQ